VMSVTISVKKPMFGSYLPPVVVGGLMFYLRYLCLFVHSGVQHILNHISGVMASVLASSAVDRGFEPRSGQTKDYTIGICHFSAKHAALWNKSKDWLARYQNNVSEWSDTSTRGIAELALNINHSLNT
jgi:hypothetical protein